MVWPSATPPYQCRGTAGAGVAACWAQATVAAAASSKPAAGQIVFLLMVPPRARLCHSGQFRKTTLQSARIDYYPRMKPAYPSIGSKWKDLDSRVKRTVEVIRYDPAKPRIRIACVQTQRLSWAKPERFNGKSGGYAKVDER
jgi:hypothetical protein